MKCPNCKTEVFDIYTTEERIKDLYKVNLNLGWAQNRIRTITEALEDRINHPEYKLHPMSMKWLAATLREIHDKMEVAK